MTRCTHCGAPADGEFELAFDWEQGSREIELALCDQCRRRLESQPDVERLD